MADICKLASSANVIQTAHLRLLGILPKTQNSALRLLADADKPHERAAGTRFIERFVRGVLSVKKVPPDEPEPRRSAETLRRKQHPLTNKRNRNQRGFPAATGRQGRACRIRRSLFRQPCPICPQQGRGVGDAYKQQHRPS